MATTGRKIATQLKHRGEIGVYANGAIEAPIQLYRQSLESRSWCFRNRRRMDLLLELMRHRINGTTDAGHYAETISGYLMEHGGIVAGPRNDYDPRGVSSLRGR